MKGKSLKMNRMPPGVIMGFREGLEACLVVALILGHLTTIGQEPLTIKACQGGFGGTVCSTVPGLGL